VRAKAGYDPEGIAVIFRVEDRYVRAVTPAHQGRVWEDSCVEFFFTPGSNPSRGYFNLEVNCGGKALFQFRKAAGGEALPVSESAIGRMGIAHTLPDTVDPEIPGPVTWTVEYRIPMDVVEALCPVDHPGPGTRWRANFFKCADLTSHPHWLTWSPVPHPRPSFHHPEHFGWLEFA
jgi:hypothetical protein